MKIRTMLRLTTAFSLALTLTLGIVLLVTLQQSDQENARHESVNRTVQRIPQLRLIAFEYLLHPEERPVRQWQMRIDSVIEAVAGMESRSPEEERALREIDEGIKRMNGIFHQMTTHHESAKLAGEVGSPAPKEIEDMLAGQLLLDSQAAIDASFALDRITGEAARKVKDRVSLFTLVFGATLLMVIASMHLFMDRKALKPIGRLHDGVGLIAAGHLDHKVGKVSEDEVSGLAVAFDKMMENIKAMTASLRDSEEKYRSVVENVGIGIALVSQDMEILAMNNRMKAWFPGLETGEKKHVCYSTLSPPAGGKPCSWCPTILALQDGLLHEIITETPTADGVKNYRVLSSPIRDREGRITAATELVEDITERKKAEVELAQHRAHLEELVARRTAELEGVNRQMQTEIDERKQIEENLRIAVKDLERSNSELQQFAYVASHDLQEPLRMVRSYVQLLARRYQGRLDQDADEFIGYAVDGATRMHRLINDLLEYSRVGTHCKPFEPTDCESILIDAMKNLETVIEETGSVVTHDPLPVIMADATQMTQLFQNLIENAIKFRGDQPPRIHISTEDKGITWCFSFRDNGIGIEAEYADRIFVIFQRLHKKDRYPGTGIGLAICKKIVERHGGRIWVESEHGKGSIFFFTVPSVGEEKPGGMLT